MFYSGKGFPGGSVIEEAMMLLHGAFLLKHQKGSHELPSQRYEKRIMGFLEDNSGDGEFLKPWLEFVDDLGLQSRENEKKLEKWEKDMMKDPAAVKALKGYDDTLRILMRYFSDGYLGYQKDNEKKSVTSAIEKVEKKYEGTIWEPILKDLASPAS